VAILAHNGTLSGRHGETSFNFRGRLSPRQREVLAGILAGKPNRIIAQDLTLSTRTVEAHRAAIMSKVGVSSLAELVQATTLATDGRESLDRMCRIYPGLISFWDSGLIGRFANHRHEMCFGESVGGILGKSIDDVFGASCCRRNAPFIEGVLSGKIQYFTQVLRIPNGRLTTFSSIYSPQFDVFGNVEGFFAFMMDTRLLPDDAWAAERDPGDTTPWAEMRMDGDSRIVSINNAFTDITQFRTDEVRGQTPIMIMPPGVEPSAFMGFWANIQAEREWRSTVWYRRRDGYLFRSRQRVTAATDKRGHLEYRVLFNEIIIP
jgi:PAS domain S-box-containing protein